MGRAKDGSTFPLSLKLKPDPESGLMASVWVFCTISGLITLLPDGTIYGINHNFALMLFGYGKSDLLGKVCLHGARSELVLGVMGSSSRATSDPAEALWTLIWHWHWGGLWGHSHTCPALGPRMGMTWVGISSKDSASPEGCGPSAPLACLG